MASNPLPPTEPTSFTPYVALLHEAAFAFVPSTGRIIAWNAHAKRLLGYDESEALDALRVEMLWGDAVALAGTAPRILSIHRRNGTIVQAEVSLSPLGHEPGAPMLALVRYDEASGKPRDLLFRSVFDQAATGIAVADLKGHLIECNQAFQTLVGFKQRELRHLSFTALSHPEDRDVISELFGDLLEGKREFCDVKKRLVQKDGRVVWVQMTVSLVKDELFRPLYGMALVNDITEERRAEQRASIQRALTTIMAENPPATMALVHMMQAICKTLDWQIGEYWAPDDAAGGLRRQASWQAPGLSASEFTMLGQHLTLGAGEGLPGMVWGNGSPAWFTDVLRESNFLRRRMAEQAGLKGALAFPVRASTGMLGVLLFAYRDFRHPDPGLLAMMSDFGVQLGQFLIRKEAERKLQLLGAIVNSSGQAIVGTDVQGTITSWNPSAERLFGYTAEEALGKPYQGLFPATHVIELDVALEKVLRGDSPPRLALVAMSKHGKATDVWVTPSRITDDHGETAGLSMTLTHATTR